MSDNAIPFNADKLLFVHDLVNHVFRSNNEVYVFHITEDYREFIYEGFSRIVEDAIEFLEETLEQEIEAIFSRFREQNKVGETDFISYGKDLGNKYFSQGFNAERFLYYCVYIALLAEHLYVNGLGNAPQLAVDLIMESFKDYDMFNGGWDSVKLIAKNYQTASLALATPSPSPEIRIPNNIEELLEEM